REPGSYYLTINLSIVGTNGIVIESSHVVLDLAGFVLGSAGNGSAVFVANTRARNVVVRNGSIQGWNTGVDGANAANSQFEALRITECTGNGIIAGLEAAVGNCQVSFNGGVGILVDRNARVYGSISRGNQAGGISAG